MKIRKQRIISDKQNGVSCKALCALRVRGKVHVPPHKLGAINVFYGGVNVAMSYDIINVWPSKLIRQLNVHFDCMIQ